VAHILNDVHFVPGEPVALEFTNGKTVSIKVGNPRDEMNLFFSGPDHLYAFIEQMMDAYNEAVGNIKPSTQMSQEKTRVVLHGGQVL
jgi:hypothetical protein